MKLKFTAHAQFRLYDRKFSIEEMKRVIRRPDFTHMAPDGKIVSEKTFTNGKLGVVYVTRGNLYIIITVYFPY